MVPQGCVRAGFVRLGMTKAAGYQEHVGEYGEHWNFFFTLAAVVALTAAVRLPPAALLPAGAVVLIMHQACGCSHCIRSPSSSHVFVFHEPAVC